MDARTDGPGLPPGRPTGGRAGGPAYGPAETAALLEDRERYRSLFTFNPHAIFSVDLEGRFLDINPAGERLSGYTQDELRTKGFLEVVAAEHQDRMFTAFLDVLERRTRYVECLLLHKDGSTVELSLVASPVVVRGQVVGVHGVAEDVTERNRLYRDLEHARETAERANAVKSVFLANMSHELRTPLTSILGMTEVLAESELDPQQQKFVGSIERAGDRLHRLVDDVLELARIETGTLELRETDLDLGQILTDLAAWAEARATAKGLAFHWRLDGRPVALLGDTLRITQVLDRLVDNAVKFTLEGEVEVVADVAVSRPGHADLTLTVRDTGVGIPPGSLDAVVEPFVQGDSSMTRRHDGAGLGLATCRHFVNRMGGTLSVESQEGTGSVFHAVLPLRTRPTP